MQPFDQVWDSHRDFLRRLLMGLAGNAELADDLTQETYLRARAGFAAYRGGDTRAWLSAIAKNAFRAHVRRRRVRQERSLDVGGELADVAVPAEGALLLSLQLRREIAHLASPLRTALVLRYYGGLSYQDIAARMRCPVGSAKWRVSEAVNRLQAAFGVPRKEVAAMAERSLRDDVLSQLDLRPLRFTIEPWDCDQSYRDAIQLTVDEVFGTAAEIRDGSNYLICGRYRMTRPVVDAMVLAASGETSGYHAFLSVGEGAFELYGHVVKVSPGYHHALSIMIFPDGGECTLVVVWMEEA